MHFKIFFPKVNDIVKMIYFSLQCDYVGKNTCLQQYKNHFNWFFKMRNLIMNYYGSLSFSIIELELL